MDIFPAFVSREDAMPSAKVRDAAVDTGAGGSPATGRSTATRDTLEAVFFKTILRAHDLYIRSGEIEEAQPVAHALYHHFGRVAVRPPIHDENALLRGQGDGLHLVTPQENLFLAPFARAARWWLERQVQLFPGLDQLTLALRDAVVQPLLAWMRGARDELEAGSLLEERQVSIYLGGRGEGGLPV